MTQSLLAHVRTWDIITNKDIIEAKACFHELWSNYPNQNITAYTRQLDRLQRDYAKLKTTISEAKRVDYFVKNMYDYGMFKAKLLEEWEATANQSWKATKEVVTKE